MPDSIDSLDDLLSALTANLCKNDCAATSVFEVMFGEDCLESYTLLYEVLGADIQRSIDAGHLSFDAVEAQRCIDALAASECGADPGSACDEVLIGQVPVGGACTNSDECENGAHCSRILACPGTCEPSLVSGAACGTSGECDTGMFCTAAGVCGPLLANGELCRNSSECETRYCQGEADGRCAEVPRSFSKALGEPCESALDCQEDLYCPLDSSAAPSCTALVGLGEACTKLTVGSTCVRAAYCALDSEGGGVCVERVPLGGACTTSDECAVGVCDGFVCERHSAIGEPCSTDARCFGVCDGGSCAAPPACPL